MAVAVSGQPINLVPPRANYPAGEYPSSQDISLAVGQSTMLVTAKRNSWPNTGAEVVSVEIDLSLDGGTTWQLLIGFTAHGGDIIGPSAAPETHSMANVPIPQPDNPNRMFRALMKTFTTLGTLVQATVN